MYKVYIRILIWYLEINFKKNIFYNKYYVEYCIDIKQNNDGVEENIQLIV